TMHLKRHRMRYLPLSAGMRYLLAAGSLVWVVAVAAGDPLPSDNATSAAPPRKNGPAATATVEVRLEDDSILKLVLKDDRIDMMTRYGRLTLPVSEIEKIDFGHRVAHDVAASVSTHIAALGSKDFQSRETATQALLKLREKA